MEETAFTRANTVKSATLINADTYIEDLVSQYPQTVSVLMRHGVICIQCGEPIWGTVGEALQRKNIQNQDQVIAELNQTISEILATTM